MFEASAAPTAAEAAWARARRVYGFNAVMTPMVRTAGFVATLAALALHNHFILGALDTRQFLNVAIAVALFCGLSTAVLHAAYRKPRTAGQFDVAGLIQFLDVVVCVVLIYFSGGEKSWLFLFIIVPVMNQTHISARRAFVYGHLAAIGYAAALVAMPGPLDAGSALTKVLLLYIAIAMITAIAMLAAGERRRVATALRSAKQEAEARTEDLAALNRITHTVASTLDMTEMLQAVTRELASLFGASGSVVALLDRTTRAPRVAASHGIAAEVDAASIADVIDSGQPVLFRDARLHPMMFVPLVAHGEVIGALGAGSDDPRRAFTHAEVALAQTVAAQLAGPIGNAGLYAAEKRSRELAERLQAAGREVSESLDLALVLPRVLDQLRHVIRYDSASIQRIEGETMRVMAVRGLPEAEVGRVRLLGDVGYNRELARRREPLILDLPAPPEIWEQLEGMEHLRTIMGVPLIVRDTVIGAMSIDTAEPRAYGPEDAEAAMAFARQVAMAIENARLYSEVLDLSWRDGLTGVPNRRRFEEVLETEWRRALRAHAAFAVMMIDIDHFKLFNDRYGHQAGDDVLREVAAVLQRGLGRAGDFLARYGGEEFVALVADCELPQALAHAETLCARVRVLAIPNEDAPEGIVTMSIGIAATHPRADCTRMISWRPRMPRSATQSARGGTAVARASCPPSRRLPAGVRCSAGWKPALRRPGRPRYKVTRLVHCEELTRVEDAIAREKQLKGWRRSKKVALIERGNPDWLDLADLSSRA
ncbi:MAG TPA: diguanylate cyclase [Thermoanaerobaculia bacterium]|nr:diguanylate cyclase [Thermoanaerobaculia bacterium]